MATTKTKKKKDLVARVEYEDGFDPDFDKRLRDIAEECRGQEWGAGFDFNIRDITYGFKSQKSLKKFLGRAKRFRRVSVAEDITAEYWSL